MSRVLKISVLVLVVLAVALILINPLQKKGFQATDRPDQAIQKSLENKKPVMMDFYSAT